MFACDKVPVEVIVPPVNPPPVATEVTPCPSLIALIVIVSPDLTVVIYYQLQ